MPRNVQKTGEQPDVASEDEVMRRGRVYYPIGAGRATFVAPLSLRTSTLCGRRAPKESEMLSPDARAVLKVCGASGNWERRFARSGARQ